MAAMTVAQLQELLRGLRPEAIIILAKDAEGNDFSPVPGEQGYSGGRYEPLTTWRGDFIDDGSPSDGQWALCLWPTN